MSGAGVRRAMERRERAEGRPDLESELRDWDWDWACGVEGGSERWASEGRRGDDMVAERGVGLFEEGRLEWEESHGFSRRGDSESENRDEAVELWESSCGGVRGEVGELGRWCPEDRREPRGRPCPRPSSKAKLTEDFLLV